MTIKFEAILVLITGEVSWKCAVVVEVSSNNLQFLFFRICKIHILMVEHLFQVLVPLEFVGKRQKERCRLKLMKMCKKQERASLAKSKFLENPPNLILFRIWKIRRTLIWNWQ